ncbi:thioesterase II family protein [Streptomyces sp. NPDC058701]|uniref:thioesterase II family protein n=1 Tax=Streptomyces sp. NPDC058701 TaxID=3346608 RepID=UPI003662EFC9
MTEQLEDSPWMRRYHDSAPGAPRLVCFPFAGGAASYFFALSQSLRPAVEVLAVQYPGRQDRIGEACLENVPELAAGVAEAVAGAADERPLVLFGHSMGALVAFETAIALSERGLAPRALLVSASRSPSVPARRDDGFTTDEELISDLRELNGTDEQLLRNAALMEVILPMVRADYRAVARYRSSPDAHVPCPITVLAGDQDPLVDESEALAWGRHTASDFRLRLFSGGHFFLDEHRDQLHKEIGLLTTGP